jgi:hypothetical protein
MMKIVNRARLVLAGLAVAVTPVLAVDCVRLEDTESLLRGSSAIFAGTAMKDTSSGVRFRVTEAFKGASGQYVDVIALMNHFDEGERYLVFAETCPDGTKRCLWVQPCSGSRLLNNARAILTQLRAEKTGLPLASVFGMVRPPLANLTVRLRSGTKLYETKTDKFGAYAFGRLQPGTYAVSVDLPPNLEVGQELGYPDLTFELSARSHREQDVRVFPKGRITGRVLLPDGQPVGSTGVDLYLAEEYQEGKRGRLGYQGALPGKPWKPFEYDHLPAGDYLMVWDNENPDTPFPRTSRLIQLVDGQQMADADIQLSNPRPTRQISVRLTWSDALPAEHYPPRFFVQASAGSPPYPLQTGRDTYTMNLFLNSHYTIHAEALCRTKGQSVTNSVTVDGSDQSMSDANLIFHQDGCGAR